MLRDKLYFWLCFNPNWGARTRLLRWDLRRNVNFYYLMLGLWRARDHTSSIKMRYASLNVLWFFKKSVFRWRSVPIRRGGYWEAPYWRFLKGSFSQKCWKIPKLKFAVYSRSFNYLPVANNWVPLNFWLFKIRWSPNPSLQRSKKSFNLHTF